MNTKNSILILSVTTLLLFAASCGSFKRSISQPHLLDFSASPQASPSTSSYNPVAPIRTTKVLTLEELSTFAGVSAGPFKLIAMDSQNQPIASATDWLELTIEPTQENPSLVMIDVHKEGISKLLLYFVYPDGSLTPKSVSAGKVIGSSDDFLFFSSSRVSGVIGIAIIALNQSEAPIPTGTVARITFSPVARAVSAYIAPTSPINAVDDLTASITPDGAVSISWTEKHPGDYNNNGFVDIQDVSPIAEHLLEKLEDTDNPGLIHLLDGTGDGRISVEDITPIAENFFTLISGYTVYRTYLAAFDENPDPADTDRWVRLRREGADPPDAPPTVVREFNGQDFRLPYSMIDRPPLEGFYAYFVRPFSEAGASPSEGTISIIAKTEQPAGQAHLLLNIVNKEGRGAPPIFAVDEEVILQVYLDNAFGVFSANVRFLYRSDYLELIEAEGITPSPSLMGYEPNLLFEPNEPIPIGGNPLFIGLDLGDATEDGYENYNWVAMNATKKKPAPPSSGSGALGYFKFRVKAAGTEPITTLTEAFRFPSSTVFIYLMGEEYGDFLPTPLYTDTEALAISSS